MRKKFDGSQSFQIECNERLKGVTIKDYKDYRVLSYQSYVYPKHCWSVDDIEHVASHEALHMAIARVNPKRSWTVDEEEMIVRTMVNDQTKLAKVRGRKYFKANETAGIYLKEMEMAENAEACIFLCDIQGAAQAEQVDTSEWNYWKGIYIFMKLYWYQSGLE